MFLKYCPEYETARLLRIQNERYEKSFDNGLTVRIYAWEPNGDLEDLCLAAYERITR